MTFDEREPRSLILGLIWRTDPVDQVVADGECGLDFNREFSPRPQQEKWFAAQVALAEELQKPLFA